jgi:hypothetical protein
MGFMEWLNGLLDKPCRFYESGKCPWADEGSEVCTKAAGHYYSHGQGGGCFRTLSKLESEGKL